MITMPSILLLQDYCFPNPFESVNILLVMCCQVGGEPNEHVEILCKQIVDWWKEQHSDETEDSGELPVFVKRLLISRKMIVEVE